MTGPEHYLEAERLIEPGEYDEAGDEALHLRDIQLAQVHATLALAAATALSRDGEMRIEDSEAWVAAASTYRPLKAGGTDG